MHGLECLDFQLMLATCLEVLRTSCYSIKKLPFIAGPCSLHIVKPNTYLGRAKEHWVQSLASESLLRAFCKLHLSAHARGRTYVRTYLLSMRIIELNARPRAYRPAEGGERACNSHTACTEGEMLAVTKNRS